MKVKIKAHSKFPLSTDETPRKTTRRESNSIDGICSLGLCRCSPSPVVSISLILNHLHHYPDGQRDHTSNNKTGPRSPDPHVFFPWQFFLFGNLLCISYTPQNAHESLDPEKNNIFSCLCCTNVLDSYAGSHRVFPFGRDGL